MLFPLPEVKKLLRKQSAKKGFIKSSTSPVGPILFNHKKEGNLHLRVDHRSLNKIPIKNKYPPPRTSELIDRLTKAKFATKIDLYPGNRQSRIEESTPISLTDKKTQVETILDKKNVKGKLYYLVKWKGYPFYNATWEPEANLTNCHEALQKFLLINEDIDS